MYHAEYHIQHTQSRKDQGNFQNLWSLQEMVALQDSQQDNSPLGSRDVVNCQRIDAEHTTTYHHKPGISA